MSKIFIKNSMNIQEPFLSRFTESLSAWAKMIMRKNYLQFYSSTVNLKGFLTADKCKKWRERDGNRVKNLHSFQIRTVITLVRKKKIYVNYPSNCLCYQPQLIFDSKIKISIQYFFAHNQIAMFSHNFKKKQ